MKDSDWEILAELYKNPNLTKVAGILSMTQPSISKRLKVMEKEYGTEIVSRSRTGLELTREGEYLAKRAQMYLEFQKETKEEIGRMQVERQELLVGSAYTYSKFALVGVLADYLETHPGSGIQIVTEKSNVLFRQLLENKLDISFIRGDYEGPVERILVDQDEGYLVTKEKISFEELSGMTMIGYKSSDKTMGLLKRWWKEQFDREMKEEMYAENLELAWNMVRDGMGYVCCFMPRGYEKETDLCLTPLKFEDGTPVLRNTWCMYSKERKMTREFGEFLNYIHEKVAHKDVK